MTLLAFIGMSLAWSFSWFAMKLQVDSAVPIEISVFYRFFFTSILMFLLCLISGQRLLMKKSELKFFLYIALTNFCLNFLFGYYAVQFVASGVLATIFCLSIISSEVISAKVDQRKIERKIIISSLVGFVGLLIFVVPLIDLQKQGDLYRTIFGILICLLMMVIYSSGNVMVGKNRQANQTPLFTSIAWCSGIGSMFILAFNLLRGNQFTFDYSAKYILSLAYLVVIASVLAFICLYYLIQKVGSARANFTALIYPVLALITSTYFENLSLTFLSFVGFAMILMALAVDLVNWKKIKNLLPKF